MPYKEVHESIVGNVFDGAIYTDLANREIGPFHLIVADPPYGGIVDQEWDHVNDLHISSTLAMWCKSMEKYCIAGAAMYMWGGYGSPGNRAFYRFVLELEKYTNWKMAAHITWNKRRAYGVQHNYLSTREEIAYCVLGNVKKPATFNVPHTAEVRGYAGYNKEYPAKSEYKRRTMVWTDITEKFAGRVHECEKPKELSRVMIETSSRKGDLVLDAFAGSGNCMTVAKELGRSCVSIEKLAKPNLWKGSHGKSER